MPVTPITILKPSSIEETPLLQHHNPIFDLQDSSSHEKFEAPSSMVEEGLHPKTEEPMNTQELLNTMVASQIQLREDMNRMMQQFQNSKSNQEEDKTDHDPKYLYIQTWEIHNTITTAKIIFHNLHKAKINTKTHLP